MPDKLLFTPGPLTTSATVKAAMQRDLGSRDAEFIAVVREVRARLVAVAGGAEDVFTAVIVQGSGTFGIEATLTTCVPRDGKLLVVVNGAYGARMVQIARVAGVAVEAYRVGEDEAPSPAEVARRLAADPGITHVAVVHCETTTGMFNPVEEIGRAVRAAGRKLIVDAMSSFGAVPLDLEAAGVDYLVSSANKCIEGVPGFSFVLARRAALAETEGWARSVTLDLHAQWRGLEENGQFRFTPPTHALLAFRQALAELEAEGGPAGRAERYKANREVCRAGLRRLGFQEFLPGDLGRGYIITSFRFPEDPRFDFATFYRRLSDRGFVIYPGKVSNADCFRIGHIGRLGPEQSAALIDAIEAVLGEMGLA
jgi:2-aminoethylphosphonate-pyruvate transaminase